MRREVANYRMERLPLNHPQRIAERDRKLAERDTLRAVRSGRKTAKCPCRRCAGITRRKRSTLIDHLIRFKRHPACRLPHPDDERDSSDEEWMSDAIQSGRPVVSGGGQPSNGESSSDTDGEHGSAEGMNSGMVQPGIGDLTASSETEDSTQTDNSDDSDWESVVMEDQENMQPESPSADANPEEEEGSDHMMDESGGKEPNRFVQLVQDAFACADGLNDRGLETAAQEPADDDEELPGDGSSSTEELKNAALRDAMMTLWEGTSMVVLEFVVILLTLCSFHVVPNVFVDVLLALLSKKILPQPNNIPGSLYKAKQILSRVGLDYLKYDCCPQHCTVYIGADSELQSCPKCRTPRWKTVGNSRRSVAVFRYFPIIPRLLRMFKCPTIADLLSWASNNVSTDGIMRHLADSPLWKHFDSRYEEFAAEPRNLRFALVSDAVSLYKQRRMPYSCWPMMLVCYNLPPWIQTKRFMVLLSMIIPGPLSVKTKSIDAYLVPLINEFQELWRGVWAYDSLRRNGLNRFLLKACLLFTIHDYVALGVVSGLCVGGKRGCVGCGGIFETVFSLSCNKPLWLHHRRNLPQRHPYRGLAYADFFDGRVEDRDPPEPPTARQIREWGRLKEQFDKHPGARQKADNDPYMHTGVNKDSIFYKLPYWESHMVRHTLDVMHIGANVCESVFEYLMGRKDTVKVRNDMRERNVRRDLWCRENPRGRGQYVKPRAPYVLSVREAIIFLRRLKAIRVPSGYSSNWSKRVDVKRRKLIGMKSHDFHVLFLQLLPACLRGLMVPEVRRVIQRLSGIYRELCAKTVDLAKAQLLCDRTAIILVELGLLFPPAFFDVMVHLLVHAVVELFKCGPVSCRWMFPFERILYGYKRSTRSNSAPEASMAEACRQDETLGYCTEYLKDFTAVRTRLYDEDAEPGDCGVHLVGKGKEKWLLEEERDILHYWVITNSPVTADWFRRYLAEKAANQESNLQTPDFAVWLEDAVANDPDLEDNLDLRLLSRPPSCKVLTFERMMAYGNHYRVIQAGWESWATYDSGISVVAETCSVATNQSSRQVAYVGELVDIYKVNYGQTSSPVVLMKGRWVRPMDDRVPGMKRDSDGFTLANFSRLLPEDQEPFVFPVQVEQVFFMFEEESSQNEQWRVVLHKPARARRVTEEHSDSIVLDWSIDEGAENMSADGLPHGNPNTYDILSARELLDAQVNFDDLVEPRNAAVGDSSAEDEDNELSTDDEVEPSF